VRSDWTFQTRKGGYNLYTRFENSQWLYMVRDDQRQVHYLGSNEEYALSFIA